MRMFQLSANVSSFFVVDNTLIKPMPTNRCRETGGRIDSARRSCGGAYQRSVVFSVRQ